MKKFERYEKSVIKVMDDLSCHDTGSCEDLSFEEIYKLHDWLAWRITEGWSDVCLERSRNYDNLIRQACADVVERWNVRRGIK